MPMSSADLPTTARQLWPPERRIGLFCPKCSAEYIPGFTRCSDCLVSLVETLPAPESEPRPHRDSSLSPPAALTDPVCVYRSVHRGRFALAKSVLGSAGVPFVVLNEALQTLTGLTGVAPVEILVSRGDAEDAQLLLEELG